MARALVIAAGASALVAVTAFASADPIDRPLTLPAHTFAAVTDLFGSHRSVTVGGITAASTSEATRVAVGYGLTDALEVSVELALSLHNFQTDQPVTLAASYAFVRRADLDVGLTAGFVVASPNIPKSRRTMRIELGVGARYQLVPGLAVFAGGSGIQSGGAHAGIGLGPLAPTALGRQLEVGLRGTTGHGPSSLELPFGVVVEATPRLELGLGTSLVHFGLANDATAYTLPIELAALVAVTTRFELTAFVEVPDLRTTALELVFFGLGARYAR